MWADERARLSGARAQKVDSKVVQEATETSSVEDLADYKALTELALEEDDVYADPTDKGYMLISRTFAARHKATREGKGLTLKGYLQQHPYMRCWRMVSGDALADRGLYVGGE